MTRTLLAALAMSAIVILQPLRVAADPVLSAPFVTVGVGDTFTIPISITGSTDVTSWQFDLAYSPSLVKANSVTEGPFMSAFGTIENAVEAMKKGAVDFIPKPFKMKSVEK